MSVEEFCVIFILYRILENFSMKFFEYVTSKILPYQNISFRSFDLSSTLQILVFCLHQGFFHLQASNQHNTLMTHLPTMQDSVHFSIFPDFWLECFGKISRGNRDKFPQHPGALYHGHRIERRDRKRRIIGRIVG